MFFNCLDMSDFKNRLVTSSFPTGYKLLSSLPISLVPSWDRAPSQLGTNFPLVSLYTLFLVGNELLPSWAQTSL